MKGYFMALYIIVTGHSIYRQPETDYAWKGFYDILYKDEVKTNQNNSSKISRHSAAWKDC